MSKGLKVETMSLVLQQSHKAGIANHVFIITNFPGDKHIEKTVEFVKNNGEYIASLVCTVFSLENRSYIYYHPQEFAIAFEPTPQDYFGPDYPYQEIPKKASRHHDYQYFKDQCQDLPFHIWEFFGYDDRRLFIHIAESGKLDIREENRKNIELKRNVTEFITQKEDFYLETNPEILIQKLPDCFLAYHPIHGHAIFNDATCALLQEAQGGIRFSHALKSLHKIFDVEPSVLKRDLEQIIPSLVVLEFIKVVCEQ
jgi:hypothetical protein